MRLAILGIDACSAESLAQALTQALSQEGIDTQGWVIASPSPDLSIPHDYSAYDLRLLVASADGAPLRQVLEQQAVDYTVVYGDGQARTDAALQTVRHWLKQPSADTDTTPWRWNCEKCSDPECEHRLFSDLLASSMRV